MKGTISQNEVELYDGHKEWTTCIDDHRCDNCARMFTHAFPENSGIQPLNALEIHFMPYYAGYFDMSGPERKLSDRMYRQFWLCESCADKLIEAFPCLKVPR